MASADVVSVGSFVVLAGLRLVFAVAVAGSRSSLDATWMSIPRQKAPR